VLICVHLETGHYKKLSCREETVQCFVSLNILLSLKAFEMKLLSRTCVSLY